MSIALLFSCRLGKQSIDYLQSAFSLKTRLVLISANAIANHDVTIRDWVQTRKNERLSFFLLVLTPSFIEDIYLYQQLHRAEFWKTCLKKAQIFAQKPGDSGDCGENSHRGLAVLVGLIVKLPWGRKGPTCQSLGEKAAAKAWYGQLVSLENQFTDHAGLL